MVSVFVTSVVLGAIASLVVQLIKKYVGTNTTVTYGVVAVISLIVAYVYGLISKDTQLLAVFVQTLAYSGAVYSFIISRFKGASTNS